MKHAVRHLTLALLIAIVVATALVRAQQGTLSAADKQRRLDMENELQSIAVVERKVMMPMPDGVRLATDIYRPKNAGAKVPVIWVRTPYNFNFWDVHNGVPADMTAALDRREARLRLRRPERARALLLRRQLRHPRLEDRRLQHRRLADEAAVVERQGRHDRLLVDRGVSDGRRRARASGLRRDERAGIRRRRRPRRPVLRAGQLVPRRRGADALHRLAVRRAEPGAADVSAEHVARRPDPRLEVVRPRPASAAGRLVEGAVAPAGAGHHQERRRPARHLRRRDAGRNRRPDDPARRRTTRRGTAAACITTTRS